jgi:hypothetical protein
MAVISVTRLPSSLLPARPLSFQHRQQDNLNVLISKHQQKWCTLLACHCPIFTLSARHVKRLYLEAPRRGARHHLLMPASRLPSCLPARLSISGSPPHQRPALKTTASGGDVQWCSRNSTSAPRTTVWDVHTDEFPRNRVRLHVHGDIRLKWHKGFLLSLFFGGGWRRPLPFGTVNSEPKGGWRRRLKLSQAPASKPTGYTWSYLACTTGRSSLFDGH